MYVYIFYRAAYKGMAGVGRPPSLLAGVSLKYFAFLSSAVNTAKYATVKTMQRGGRPTAMHAAIVFRFASGSSLGNALYPE
jgi:hypothetical protein